MASSEIAATSSALRQPPVGLAGVLRMIIRVRSVTSCRNSSTSSRKPRSSRIAIGTGTAPTKEVREW